MTDNSRKTLKIVSIALIYLATIVLACVSTYFITRENCQTQPTSAYKLAVNDSIDADEEEIFSLVSITKDSPMVTWDSLGEKVLMLSWHRYPDSYPNGGTFECKYGEIWTFTDKEMLSWYNQNNAGVNNWELRFEQLLGLPIEKLYTHFTAFWVDEEELIRPAYQPDITKQVVASDLDGKSLGEHAVWFNANSNSSYEEGSAYPWTRLGYTYDWFEDEKDYGLTEFIILPNSIVEIEWTVTTAEFLEMLKQGSLI